MMEMPQMKLARTSAQLSLMAALAFAGSIALSAGTAPIRLLGVSAQGNAVLIESTEPVAYAVNNPDPLTVVVDMRNVSVEDAANAVRKGGAIAGVSLEQATAADGKSVARVRVALASAADYKVRSARNTIRVELTPRPQKAAARAAAPSLPLPAATDEKTAASPFPDMPSTPATPSARMTVPAASATVLDGVRAVRAAAATTVTLRGNGRLTPSSVSEASEGPRRLVLDFMNVASKAPAVTSVDSTLVSKVRVSVNTREPLVTRVAMDLGAETTYHVERAGADGEDLAVVFEPAQATSTILLSAEPTIVEDPEPAIPMTQAIANAAAITQPEPADPMSALNLDKPAPSRTAAPAATRPAAQPPARQAAPAAAPASARQTPPPMSQQQPAPPVQSLAQPSPQDPSGTQPEKRYNGAPITLDFAGVDLRSVLRLFNEPSGLNIIIDPGVPATPVDILLKDIPWDQALEIILRTHQLGYEVDGTVIRIAPLKVLEEEQRQRSTLAAARALAGDLRVQTFSLSYAKADGLAPLLVKSALSTRGQIQVDPRTNTIIITDLPDRLQTVANLIGTLDRPEPQVEVEARVVQTTRDFARAIGVQWGLNGRVAPDIGNTTPLAFPNRGTLGGRTGQANTPNDPRADPTEATGTAVNLPVEGATSAIGLALGAVNGAFNLDVALSALERTGKGRVLSTPRLTTQNNIEAEVAQGIQIPIQVVANNTVTVTFKDAVLLLKVTPQITSANTVIMKVTLENATPDFSRQVNGIPPIDTQRATTQVQVNDGATTVIGGIFVSREQISNERTPLLHRIPLLGWMFRRDSTADESRELLIFITPRILKG
jgi:type IV pilus assembly protein PilQ